MNTVSKIIEGRETDSSVSVDLIEAYRSTDYVVCSDPPMTLKIGQRSDALIRLLEQHGSPSGAFITAWNPFSERRTESENRTAQERLLEDLSAAGAICIAGYGQASTGSWPAEDSVLAIGLNRDDTIKIGRRYQQNAVVYSEIAGVPQLILLV